MYIYILLCIDIKLYIDIYNMNIMCIYILSSFLFGEAIDLHVHCSFGYIFQPRDQEFFIVLQKGGFD